MILILFFAHKASSSHTTDLSHTLDDTHSPGWHISAFVIPERQMPRNTACSNQEAEDDHPEMPRELSRRLITHVFHKADYRFRSPPPNRRTTFQKQTESIPKTDGEHSDNRQKALPPAMGEGLLLPYIYTFPRHCIGFRRRIQALACHMTRRCRLPLRCSARPAHR